MVIVDSIQILMPNHFEQNPKYSLVRNAFSNKGGKYFTDTTGNDISNNNPGAPMPSERPVADWWSKYVNSPKYKERLAGFYQYPDYVQRQRSGLINSMTFRENPGTGSAYYDNGNEVAMSNLQAQALNASRQEIAAHEMGHAVNSNRYVKGAALAPAEADFILKRNKQISPSVLQRFQTLSKESGKPLTELMSGELHDVDPSENLSDIQSLRYLLKQRKLYDAGQQNATPEIIKKAASDPVIRRSFIWKRLKESFGEKELLEIMNKVAINSNKNSSNTA